MRTDGRTYIHRQTDRRMEGRKDRQKADMENLIFSFCNFAKAPDNTQVLKN